MEVKEQIHSSLKDLKEGRISEKKDKKIEKIVKYPRMIEGDMIAMMVWDSLYGTEGLTKTALKKEVYLKVLRQVSKYRDIEEVIEKLQTRGLLGKKTISKEFEVLVPKKGENYITGEKNG